MHESENNHFTEAEILFITMVVMQPQTLPRSLA